MFSRYLSTPKKPAPEAPNVHVTGPGQPLELVQYDTNTGKFSVGQQALKVLRSIKGPVGVVSVCGRARQGKSYILNQLLGQSSGFVVAPTHRPCTKGLWMWSAPVARESPDGSTYHLVLLDTEGIDAYDQTGQYSTQIFSLAVLLSSLFVYNQMGGIDEAALDRLSLVTEMIKHIRVKAGATPGESEAELSEFTPAFLWLLRDFYLTLEEDGHQITPREYLETALKLVPGDGRAVEAKNQIRESIKSLFPNRDCFALVRPMSDESQLQRLESVLSPSSALSSGMQRLTRLIFARTQPKRLGNNMITGSMLAALAEAYVDAINHGAVPTIATAWQGVAEAECRRAADDAEKAYHEAFDRTVAPTEAQLAAEHNRALVIAKQTYDANAVGEPSVRHANEARWRERAADFDKFQKERLASAELELQRLINEETARLTQQSQSSKLRQDGGAQYANRADATLDGLKAELARFEAAYNAAPPVAAKYKLMSDFLRGTYGSIQAALLQRTQQAAQEQAAAVQRRAADLERSAQQAEVRIAQLERQVEALQAQLAAEQSRASQAAAQLEAGRRAAQQSAQSLEEARRELGSRQQAAEAGVATLTHQLEEARRQLAAGQGQLEASTSLAQSWTQKAQIAQADLAAAVAARDAAQAEARAKDAALQALQADKEALAKRLAGVEGEHAAVLARLTQSQALLEQARAAPPATETAGESMEFEDAGEGEDADVNPDKMTIQKIKDWLTERGHEDTVWRLNNEKAKKPQYVAAMNDVLGRR